MKLAVRPGLAWLLLLALCWLPAGCGGAKPKPEPERKPDPFQGDPIEPAKPAEVKVAPRAKYLEMTPLRRALLPTLERLVKMHPDPMVRAIGLADLGYVAVALGDLPRARAFADEVLGLLPEVSSQSDAEDFLYAIGIVFGELGECERPLRVKLPAFDSEARRRLRKTAERHAVEGCLEAGHVVAAIEVAAKTGGNKAVANAVQGWAMPRHRSEAPKRDPALLAQVGALVDKLGSYRERCEAATHLALAYDVAGKRAESDAWTRKAWAAMRKYRPDEPCEPELAYLAPRVGLIDKLVDNVLAIESAGDRWPAVAEIFPEVVAAKHQPSIRRLGEALADADVDPETFWDWLDEPVVLAMVEAGFRKEAENLLATGLRFAADKKTEPDDREMVLEQIASAAAAADFPRPMKQALKGLKKFERQHILIGAAVEQLRKGQTKPAEKLIAKTKAPKAKAYLLAQLARHQLEAKQTERGIATLRRVTQIFRKSPEVRGAARAWGMYRRLLVRNGLILDALGFLSEPTKLGVASGLLTNFVMSKFEYPQEVVDQLPKLLEAVEAMARKELPRERARYHERQVEAEKEREEDEDDDS